MRRSARTLLVLAILVGGATWLLGQTQQAPQQNFSAGNLNGIGITNGLFTTPALTGLTNGTGLQLFNTATSCTTAATINTPCTTASISLPVGYSDTNYRVLCQGLGVTAFPQLQTVTKSNATFTITLNNLTAAAATYASFDCAAAHN